MAVQEAFLLAGPVVLAVAEMEPQVLLVARHPLRDKVTQAVLVLCLGGVVAEAQGPWAAMQLAHPAHLVPAV
jgi:hypothetical protein